MKVWLDDVRPHPEGWVRCYWPNEVIKLLQAGDVDEMSLDHDLGSVKRVFTGMHVLDWLEEKVALREYTRPIKIHVHSQNWVARPKMELIARRIRTIRTGGTVGG